MAIVGPLFGRARMAATAVAGGGTRSRLYPWRATRRPSWHKSRRAWTTLCGALRLRSMGGRKEPYANRRLRGYRDGGDKLFCDWRGAFMHPSVPATRSQVLFQMPCCSHCVHVAQSECKLQDVAKTPGWWDQGSSHSLAKKRVLDSCRTPLAPPLSTLPGARPAGLPYIFDPASPLEVVDAAVPTFLRRTV